MRGGASELKELRFECAWRLGSWSGSGGASSAGSADSWSSGGIGDDLVDGRGGSVGAGFHEMLHGALGAMQQGRLSVAQSLLRRCAINRVARLGGAGEEGGQRSIEDVIALRMVSDAKDVARALELQGNAAAAVAAVRVSGAAASPAAQARRRRLLLGSAGGEFEIVEPLLALHAALLRRFAPMEREPLARHLLHAASIARESGGGSVAGRLLAEAASLPSTPAIATCVRWEYAQLLWDEGSRGQPCARAQALQMASHLAQRATGPSPVSAHERAALVQACRVSASWGITEGQCGWEGASALYERALRTCGEDVAGADGVCERCDTHAAFAAWLEAEHRAAHHQAASPDELRSAQLYELAQKELHAATEQQREMQTPLRGRGSRGGDSRDSGESGALQKRIALLQSHIEMYEQHEARRHDADLLLASRALRQHAECARSGDAHDHTSLFSIVGLWLEYGGRLSEAKAELSSIPTRKLLPLISQLACRLGPTGGEGHAFQTALRHVLLRVAKAHLHVVLPHLISLAYGDRYAPEEETPAMDRGQLEAAKELISQLRLAGGAGGGVVQATELLYDMYLQLAWANKKATDKLWKAASKPAAGSEMAYPRLKDLMSHSSERKPSDEHPFSVRKGSELFALVQEGHANLAALPTHTAASTSGAAAAALGEPSSEVVHFSHFGPASAVPTGTASRTAGGRREAVFSTAGGINLPKIVYCYGDDGRMHKQLVKGRDDLRGDAVMQQVFGLVNVLLGRDDATRQRSLRMRTYRVVPIAPTAGVVQWVDETMPLSAYLTGGQSAHERYRPNDWSHSKSRELMSNTHKALQEGKLRKTAGLDAYRQVEQNLRPVLHHFFLERWHAPAAWFARRLAYTASVAAGSMIGYVLGLGDRHSSNILIDTRSAELVHIDLGIAFDQGRLLKTPECVPFRLTRDIEDGLGVSGVDGVLTGSAEQTMRVLRANSDALITILEVMLRNPLYKWSLDPIRSAAAGGPGGGKGGDGDGGGGRGSGVAGTNREAERSLVRIKEKLAGRVADTSEALAVEGQVRALLDEARDPENLCRMFDGWAAWL